MMLFSISIVSACGTEKLKSGLNFQDVCYEVSDFVICF